MLKLLESGAKRKRSKAGLATSFAVHGGLIALAIAMTSHVATSTAEPLKAENIEYVAPPPPKVEKVYVAPREEPKKAPPKPKAAAPRPRRAAPRPPAPRPQVAQAPTPAPAAPAPVVPSIAAPIAVPTSIPAPDLSGVPTATEIASSASKEIAGTSKGESSGSSGGAVTGTSDGDVSVGASRDDGSAWGEEQVDVAVRQQGAANLRYPERLRASNISGTVMMRFVVGTNGRVEMNTVEVIDSPHEEFTDAVKDALKRMRYRPAEVRGTKVRQLVEQNFTFKLG